MLLSFFASETASAGVLGALGIDWRALLLNAAAFLIIVGLLSKFVYPPLTKALDRKQDELSEAARLEREAQQHFNQAQHEAARLIAEARTAAEEVLSDARDEAGALMDKARTSAEAQAERLVIETHERLVRETEQARMALRQETARLVAEATGAVLEEKLDSPRDMALIGRELERSR